MRPQTCARALAVSLITGCASQPATTPSYSAPPVGMTVAVRTILNNKITGELIAIDDSSFVVRDEARFARVRADRIAGIELKGWKTSVQGRGAWNKLWQDVGQRQQFQLRSRYPPGLTPDIEAMLLRAYGSSQVEWLP